MFSWLDSAVEAKALLLLTMRPMNILPLHWEKMEPCFLYFSPQSESNQCFFWNTHNPFPRAPWDTPHGSLPVQGTREGFAAPACPHCCVPVCSWNSQPRNVSVPLHCHPTLGRVSLPGIFTASPIPGFLVLPFCHSCVLTSSSVFAKKSPFPCC